MNKYQIAELLEAWQKETDNLAQMSFRIEKNNVFIYTDRPGILIGKGGQIINNFQSKASQIDPNLHLNLIEVTSIPYTSNFGPKQDGLIIISGSQTTENPDTYVKCPFCGAYHILRIVSQICDCGAKFYPQNGYWLSRSTGEKINLSLSDKLKVDRFIENY